MRLSIFLHIAGMGDADAITAELCGAILGSGLYAEAESLQSILVGGSLNYPLPQRWRIERRGSLDQYEYPTLAEVWRWSQSASDDQAALYLHTKGASKGCRVGGELPSDAWRRYMLAFVVERWRECRDLLSLYQTVGTEIRLPPRHVPHYAGNFWYARASYLRRLQEPKPIKTWGHERYGAETWLLSGMDRAENHFSYMSLDAHNERRIAKEPLREGVYRGGEV